MTTTYTTTYNALTPFGAFSANWGEDEDSRVEYTGSPDAIAYFKAFLDLNSVSGRGGALIQFDSLEPVDLYGFCQSEKYEITVLPTVDDLKEENNDMGTTMVLDAVGTAETFQLIGEGAQILQRLDENAETFFGDLGRLREIITALGDDAPATPDPRETARAYMQSVIEGSTDLSAPSVAAELGKIHGEHKDDADMLALFKSAVKAYSTYALARADEVLNKG
jgi:hypothetical protein